MRLGLPPVSDIYGPADAKKMLRIMKICHHGMIQDGRRQIAHMRKVTAMQVVTDRARRLRRLR